MVTTSGLFQRCAGQQRNGFMGDAKLRLFDHAAIDTDPTPSM
jgi:hypothetical protein